MEFTEEQQTHIDKMISKRVAEIKSKHEADLAEKIAEAQAEAATEAQTLKAELEKVQADRGGDNERVRKALLRSEVAPIGVVNTDQVMRLVDDAVKLGDDGNLRVVDDEGNERLDESGAPLTVKSFMEGFLQDNPHLKKGVPRAGSGSSSSMFSSAGGRQLTRAEFDGLDPARRSNYIQSGGSLKD